MRDKKQSFLFFLTVCLLGCSSLQAPLPSGSHSSSSEATEPKIVSIPINKDAGYQDGSLEVAKFNAPQGLALDKEGNVYVADTNNQRIRKISQDRYKTVSTFAGNGPTDPYVPGTQSRLPFGYKDGPKDQARFNGPQDVVFDEKGNLYVSDTNNQRIRKISPDGMVSTLAGSSPIQPHGGVLPPGHKDGPGKEALFNYPWRLSYDKRNKILYVLEDKAIRKITSEGIVSTLTPPPSQIVSFQNISNLATDSLGNLYLTVWLENSKYRIQKVTLTGDVITIGKENKTTETEVNDGPLESAVVNNPIGLVVDNQDNLYFYDSTNTSFYNHIIRKAANSIISTVKELDFFIKPVEMAMDERKNLFYTIDQRLHKFKTCPCSGSNYDYQLSPPVESLLAASETLEIQGQNYKLQAGLGRDVQPGHNQDECMVMGSRYGTECQAIIIQLKSEQDLYPVENIERFWVINNQKSIWEHEVFLYADIDNYPGDRAGTFLSVQNGPPRLVSSALALDTNITVVVKVKMPDGSKKLLKASNVLSTISS